MSHIEREIVINRPVEEVFDFLADGRNEPQYNPHMLRAEQTSAGPVGPGTQFRTEVTNNGRSMEMVYERPNGSQGAQSKAPSMSRVPRPLIPFREAPTFAGSWNWSRAVSSS